MSAPLGIKVVAGLIAIWWILFVGFVLGVKR